MAKNENTRRGPSAEEISGFCSQIAMMLDAGVPLSDGLEMLAAEGEAEKGDLYAAVSHCVSENGSLHDALAQDERWPRYMVEMVGIGEETGHLDRVMRGLTAYYDREDKIRSALSHAIAYPLLLGALLLLVVLTMLWKVLPMFRQVLTSMGIGATQSGSRSIELGATIGWIVLIVVGVVFCAALLCLLVMKTKKRAALMAFFRRRVPLVHTLTKRLSATRIASVLAMTIGSGYPVESALDMVKQVLEDGEAEAKLAAATEKINEGTPMATALSDSGLFEPLHGRMLRVAAASGHEEDTLENLAAIYEDKAEEDVGRLLSIVEPTLVAVLSVVIGAILLSVMLPMAGVLTSML